MTDYALGHTFFDQCPECTLHIDFAPWLIEVEVFLMLVGTTWLCRVWGDEVPTWWVGVVTSDPQPVRKSDCRKLPRKRCASPCQGVMCWVDLSQIPLKKFTVVVGDGLEVYVVESFPIIKHFWTWCVCSYGPFDPYYHAIQCPDTLGCGPATSNIHPISESLHLSLICAIKLRQREDVVERVNTVP
jgi:hypothetical protein